MFGNKEIPELKEEINKKFEELKTSYAVQTETHNQAIEELKSQIRELLESKQVITAQVKTDLTDINRLKSEFEISLNRLESTQRTIEDRAAESIKEVVEKEIETIRQNAKTFRDTEQEMKKILTQISELQLELSKFITISQQIKLVDFTLKQHTDELKNSEKERMELINENERLKSIMAKMKRHY